MLTSSATPHPANTCSRSLRRGAAEPLSSAADAAPQSAAVPTTGSVRVGSRPMGARVSFDGRVVGETPIIVTNVTLGEHQIGLGLEGKGYQPGASSVIVHAGHEQQVLAVN